MYLGYVFIKRHKTTVLTLTLPRRNNLDQSRLIKSSRFPLGIYTWCLGGVMVEGAGRRAYCNDAFITVWRQETSQVESLLR